MISKNQSKLRNMIGRRKPNSSEVISHLMMMFPNAQCELVHHNSFQLLIAVMLSAQTTDQAVNKVTPQLFAHFPTPRALAVAPIEQVEADIKTLGLYHSKARHIIETAQQLLDHHNSEVPATREALESLPGVGRKTTNVVLSVAFHIPAIAVDTHVERVSKRLGFAPENATPKEVELRLMKLFPKDTWNLLHHQLIFLGRYQCKARSPQCETCALQSLCRYYQTTQPK